MAQPKFSIPKEFADAVRVVKDLDPRSNAEIIDILSNPGPITSEKNIWCFWDKGLRRMPEWSVQNVCDWVRICSRGSEPWTVRFLDAVPESPNYALNFVPEDLLPQCFVDGEMTGQHVGPHSADFLRGSTVYLHGGLYLDVGTIMVRNPDHWGWNQINDPSTPFEVAITTIYGTSVMNHFVMCRKGNDFVKRWHELFVHLWSGRKDNQGICDDPLVSFLVNLDLDAAKSKGIGLELKVSHKEFMEYIAQCMAWSRLCCIEDSGDGFRGTDYWQNKIFLLNAMPEIWGAESIIGFRGQAAFDALATRLDADPQSEAYKSAYKAVWTILTGTSMEKIVHGKNMLAHASLGMLWDMPENAKAHNRPGTFAELLRYGSVHFEQTRGDADSGTPEKPDFSLRKGVLEP